MKLGVIGYSAQEFDVDTARKILEDYIDHIIDVYGNVEIVSGYTNLGIPALAYEIASKRGLITVGIACSKAEKYDCYDCDRVYIVGDNWGDESSTFIDYCDRFVRVGGGKQSLAEVEEIKVAGKFVNEFDID